MQLKNLKATPMMMNFVGALHGITRFFNYPYTQQWLMGGTGVAFLMNIHEDLCPSGPYCFNYDFIMQLGKNLGLEFEELGFISGESPQDVRSQMEYKIKQELNADHPLIIQNLDNQIITGYSKTAFLLDPNYPDFATYFPKTLTFGSWQEFEQEMHCYILSVKKRPMESPRKTIHDALEFAADVIAGNHPYHLDENSYTTGIAAYDVWLRFLQSNDGTDHGHWWNGSVWAECRHHAALFLRDLSQIDEFHDQEISKRLESKFFQIAHYLDEVKVKETPVAIKQNRLQKAKKLEASTIKDLRSLTKSFL